MTLVLLDQRVGGVQILVQRVLPARGESPSSPMRARERSVELTDQLSTLKPEYREVIVLRILRGLTFDEIAERLNSYFVMQPVFESFFDSDERFLVARARKGLGKSALSASAHSGLKWCRLILWYQ